MITFSFLKQKIKRLIHGPSEQSKRIKAWNRDNGEELRRNYNLSKDSLIIDVGGYEGEWADNMFERYGSRIYIFEPVSSFCKLIEKRLGHHKQVTLFPFGLAGKTEKVDVLLDNNSSSLFSEGVASGAPSELISLVSGSDFFRDHAIENVDLMKLNIEGAEYDLLDNLVASGDIKKVANLQVQFHDFVPNAESRMKSIQDALSKTHHLTYQYPFVWENWKRND